MTPASVQYVLWSEVARTAGLDFGKNFRVVIINGSGPQVKALLGKHIDMVSGDVPSNIEYVKDGRMQFLAVSNPERVPQIANVPTQKELGYDVNLAVTRAVFAPKGTPKEVIAKIAKAYEMASKDPAVVKKIEDLGNQMLYLDPQQTKEYFGKLDKIYKSAFEQQK
jgi:tripartite-type tricarboxylate transporter receptor subunit TctC